MFSIIAAVDENFAIGYKNNLLCRISDDMKRFKSLTMGKKVLVGRKTFESIKNGLPGRKMIVVTNNKNYKKEIADDNEICYDLKKFLMDNKDTPEEIFIIGGAQIYSLSIAYAKRIYLTHIKNKFLADTYFPKINESDWQIERSPTFFDAKNNVSFQYEDYKRIN